MLELRPPASKSESLRATLLAALAEGESRIANASLCEDQLALEALLGEVGVKIFRGDAGLVVRGNPRWSVPERLSCGESAFLLRSLAPLLVAMGARTTLCGSGSLPGRDHRDAVLVVKALGGDAGLVDAPGILQLGGGVSVSGRVALPVLSSSQPLSGAVMALPLMGESVALVAPLPVPSRGYIALTLEAMRRFGVEVTGSVEEGFSVLVGAVYRPTDYVVEGDWSAASFLVVASVASGKPLRLVGLRHDSLQPDRLLLEALGCAGVRFEWEPDGALRVEPSDPAPFTLDCSDAPDLIPPLVVLASMALGESRIGGASRLENKESDRSRALAEGFAGLSIPVHREGDYLVVRGAPPVPRADVLPTRGDHRIAMSLAVACLRAGIPLRLDNTECVSKSYPGFWGDVKEVMGGDALAI